MDHDGGLTIYNVMFYVVIPGAVKTVEPTGRSRPSETLDGMAPLVPNTRGIEKVSRAETVI